MLFVDGSWRVSGDVSWSGLVVVFGDVLFAPGSRVVFDGALWQAGERSSRMILSGESTVLYSSAALRQAATALPQQLPRLPRAVAWREIL